MSFRRYSRSQDGLSTILSIWQSVLKGLTAIFSDTQYAVSQVAAIGITNQRETAVLWDSQTGEAVHNAIVWQCRRTTDVCEGLKAAGHEALIKARSGLVLDPYFSATKFKWLLDNAPTAKVLLAEGRLLAGTIDTYLMWRLSNGTVHKTDVSNASRTSLMSLETLDWDDELLDIFGVPRDILPKFVLPVAGLPLQAVFRVCLMDCPCQVSLETSSLPYWTGLL